MMDYHQEVISQKNYFCCHGNKAEQETTLYTYKKQIVFTLFRIMKFCLLNELHP